MRSGSIKVVVAGFVVGCLAIKRPSISTMSTAVLIVASYVRTVTPALLADLRAMNELNNLPTISRTHPQSRR